MYVPSSQFVNTFAWAGAFFRRGGFQEVNYKQWPENCAIRTKIGKKLRLQIKKLLTKHTAHIVNSFFTLDGLDIMVVSLKINMPVQVII